MAYKEQLTLKARGIFDYSDTLASVPEGSLKVATNVVLDKNDLISPRRGYEALPGSISGTIKTLHQYTNGDGDNYLIAHTDGTTLKIYEDGIDTWHDIAGTFNVPSAANAIRTVEASKNIYFTTSKGVQKIDDVSTIASVTSRDSGAPQGLDISVVSWDVGGWLPDQDYVAYRALWGYKDANDNTILGAPSSAIIYQNTTGGAVSPIVRVRIPTPPVDVTWFVQLYRTASASTRQGVGDEMQQVSEVNPTAGEITVKFMEITDPTADNLRGTALYTNASQEGNINANFQPPQCVDMALFQSHMFYANTETKYDFEFTLLNAKLSSGASNSTVKDGDTITIDGVTYTGKATEDAANKHFAVGDTGDDVANIRTTAQSLVSVINTSTDNTTVWAVYASGETDFPGKIRLFERDFGDAPDFAISATSAAAYSPDLTGEVATNNKKPNRVYYSKFQEPEAVPILNFFDVGPANKGIQRILPLRSILLIFTDDAIYRLTGTTAATFQVTLLDSTTKLLAPESLVSLNNTATGLFDQGVAQVSSSSVQIISRPIEGRLLSLRGATGDNLSSFAFGVSYESDRKYLLSVPQLATDTTNTIIYVFNTVTESWTTYDLARTAGIVRDLNDRLHFGSEDLIHRERKQFNESDYSEEAIDVSASAVDVTKTIITLDSVVGVVAGYLYYESSSKFSRIVSVDAGASTITVLDPLEWLVTAAEVRPYITTTIEWNPITADTPNMLKQWAECTLIVERPLQDATLGFSTVLSGGFESVTFTDNPIGQWGLFPWGDVPWGGTISRQRYRTYVPRDKQRDTLIVPKLIQNTVFAPFEISGLSFYFRTISNRVSR